MRVRFVDVETNSLVSGEVQAWLYRGDTLMAVVLADRQWLKASLESPAGWSGLYTRRIVEARVSVLTVDEGRITR